ncbi:hypothetical protein K432DRAFT_137371 [Lepidopterella palustris CBS 459.81]|uniref:GPI anchored serine-rich protein n=1 Tax=Lepidopterella palustris CBS 459.81 TaxID=1314670 RepID=A0A8E2EIK5_9PEZI|nr:hypothetical protein K432DRAFT_137371 [Lepidopterella palustris CBS 459.81]
MRASTVVAAFFAAAASAAPHYGGYGEESVVYSTEEITVTSCGPEITNCPARSKPTPSMTSAAPVYTSAAPVYNSSVPLVTKTVYSTQLITVISCAPTVTNFWGTASSSGVIKPSSYPPTFTGAASHAQAGIAAAGLGALAAFLL